MDAAILKQLDKSSNSTDSWLKDGEIFFFACFTNKQLGYDRDKRELLGKTI